MGARNIFGAFVIAIALFSFWPFVVGRYQQIGALRQALAERQALMDERQQALDNFNSELNRYRTMLTSEDQDKFTAMVPAGRSTAELISALDALANSSGIRLLEASINEPAVRGGATGAATTLQIVMDLEGNYAGLKTFLSQLEQNVRLLDIQALEIAESDVPGELTVGVTTNAYFLR